MDIEFRLSNYRSFSGTDPLKMNISDGFTALIGPNNAGKSSVLRFFFEFRSLLRLLGKDDGNLLHALRGNPRSISLGSSVKDNQEIFSNQNNDDLKFKVSVNELSHPDAREPATTLRSLEITIARNNLSWTAVCRNADGNKVNLTPNDAGFFEEGERTFLGTEKVRHGSLTSLFGAFQLLSDTFFIPSFRNAINVGSNENYFDMRVGEAFISNWRAFKTGFDKSSTATADSVTRDIARIFEYERLEINASNDGTTLQLLIDGQSLRLDEVGSGLAQFIISLINIANLPLSSVATP